MPSGNASRGAGAAVRRAGPSKEVVILLRDGVPIGAITVARRERGLFPQRQVELLKTFADQAVIAIENVRLFNELQLSNRDLTEALDKQTATSEILRVISSSPTDEKPVFDAIARSSVQLCAAAFAVVASFDGESLHFVAGFERRTDARPTPRTPPRPGGSPAADSKIPVVCCPRQENTPGGYTSPAPSRRRSPGRHQDGAGVPDKTDKMVMGQWPTLPDENQRGIF